MTSRRRRGWTRDRYRRLWFSSQPYRWVCVLFGDTAAGGCPCSPRDAKPGNRPRQWPNARRGLLRWLPIRVDNGYAAMVEAGDNFWTPERVEYDLDPHATACCEHFAPIESAMRAAGLKVRLGGPSTVSAECVVDPEALAQKFPLPEGIGYQEWYSRDRSGDDPPHALLFCPTHHSRVWVVHAREASPGTPTFPSAA